MGASSALQWELAEREVSEWEDSCLVLWREWFAEMVVVQLGASQARVSWH